MSSFTRLHEDSNNIGIEFLLAELDTARTFLDVADTTGSSESRERNRNNARTAYETARRMQSRVMMGSAQKQLFQERMTKLRKRFEDAGVALP